MCCDASNRCWNDFFRLVESRDVPGVESIEKWHDGQSHVTYVRNAPTPSFLMHCFTKLTRSTPLIALIKKYASGIFQDTFTATVINTRAFSANGFESSSIASIPISTENHGSVHDPS